jgi:hypothetical protein
MRFLCSSVFNALAPKLSSTNPMLDKGCSPSALNQLAHGFSRHALAVRRFGVAHDLGNRGVTKDGRDLVLGASNLSKPPRGRFAQAVRRHIRALGCVTLLTKPVAETV